MKFASFDEPRTLDRRLNSGSKAVVTAIQNKVYAVWQQQQLDTELNESISHKERMAIFRRAQHFILYKISKDNGESFGEMGTLYRFNSRPVGDSPEIAASATNGRIFVVWSDEDKSKKHKLLLAISTGDDSGFDDPIIINEGNRGQSGRGVIENELAPGSDPGLSRGIMNMRFIHPKLVVEGENVYIFWCEGDWNRTSPDADSVHRLYFRASNDGGRSFGKEIHVGDIRLSPKELVRMLHIRLAAKGSNVYLMWCDFTPVPHQMPNVEPNRVRAFLAVSKDTGRTFSKPIDLDKETSICQGDVEPKGLDTPTDTLAKGSVRFYEKMPFDIAVGDEGAIYILLIGHHKFDMMRSIMDMMTKGMIPTRGGLVTLDVQLSLYLARSNDHGSSFTEPVQICQYSAGIDDTYLVSSGKNHVHILWTDHKQDGSFFVRSSKDGGVTFLPPYRLKESRSHGAGHHPYYSCDILDVDGHPCMAYPRESLQSTKLQGPNSELFLMIGLSEPVTLDDPSKPIADKGTSLDIHARAPYLASSGNHIYVVWSEAKKNQASVRFLRARFS